MDGFFQVAPECHELGLRAGAIVVRDIQIAASPSELRDCIDVAVNDVRRNLPEMGDAKSTAELQAIDEIFRACGVKPRKHSSSVHRLYHGAIKRNSFPTVNNLVDAYNLISLRSRCTVGAHDLTRFAHPCQLKYLHGDEVFIPLGQSEPVPVIPGEFAYVDANDRVMCRLNVLQADYSKVTDATTAALVIIEGSAAHSEETLRQTFDECQDLIRKYCGGSTEVVAWPL